MPRRPLRSNLGFTIVELIVVIVLLSVLSITAMSKFVRPSAFAPDIVNHAFISEVRMAQQLATARVDAVVTLTVDQFGTDWRFRIATDVDGLVRSEIVGVQNTTVQAASGLANDMLGPATALLLQFSSNGDLAAVSIGGNPGDPTLGVALTLAGDSNRQACIYPTGYAADAVCV